MCSSSDGASSGPTTVWNRDEHLRFLVVGGWNTVFGYGCYVAFYALLHDRLDYLAIGLVAHAIAIVNAFAMHRILVFRSSGGLFADFVRFNLSQMSVLISGLAALWCLVGLLHVAPLVAQAFVTAVAIVASYLVHRHFTFRRMPGRLARPMNARCRR